MRKWLYRIGYVLGLIAFALVVWFAGPLIGFGETRPFDAVWVRLTIIGVVFAIVGIIEGIRFWRRRRAARALEAAVVKDEKADGDGKVLGDKMKEAIETLKRSSGKKNYLYELPWYIIIGPPGAGKTTALVKSGLKFPLAGADGGVSVAGTGGTRYCDWWFTEDAVLIDTAGRYTTQDSEAEVDRKSWLSFLTLLKTARPKQPINGVILAISLEDIMKSDEAELAAHTNAIRKRLLELHKELKVDFPVYGLFTKADLIAGFTEYFGNFTEGRRRKVWGATFQTSDRKKNMVSEVPAEFDLLVRRLTEELSDRLHEEPDGMSRIAIFGFPEQFARLKERVVEFLNKIFEPNRYQANANLRGFYFSSGTQEGTPIDQVLGAMDRSFGEGAGSRYMSGGGKSFFLNELLTKVIFAESGWVSLDLSAVRRSAVIRYGAMSAIGLVTVAVLSAWGWSFVNNRSLIKATDNAMNEYRVNAAPQLASSVISDTDLHNVIGVLHQLRTMPVGYANRDLDTPTGEGFGLAQRPRLVSAAQSSYRQALERMFRSRLILRLERQIESSMNDPIVVYEALKVYLMLGGQAKKVDKELIVAWMKQDWEQNLYPGPQNRQGRIDLEDHLRAMLELDQAQKPTFVLNEALIESAQRSLARMNMADQAYALIRSTAYSAPIENFNISARAGADAKLVFETVDGTDLDQLAVPGIYTYAGFHNYFLDQLALVAEKLANEQWVMGKFGEQEAVEAQFAQLGPTLLDRYAREFEEEWTKVLDNIKLRPLTGDKPQYMTLAAASAPTSPIRLLFEAIRDETMLTRDVEEQSIADVVGGGDLASEATGVAGEAAQILAKQFRDRQGGLARIGIDLAIRKSESRAGQMFGTGGNNSARVIPGANVEGRFKAYQMLVDGEVGRRPIDTLVQNLYEAYQNLVLSATAPSQSERANAGLQMQVVGLRSSASRLPPPLARMINTAVDDFEGDAAGSSIARLNEMMASTVTRTCEQVIANRYPFSRKSERDVPMGDFAKLFAPNGIIDRYFVQNISQLVDMSGKTWEWKQDTRLGRELSKTTLREFQRAAEIRDAFFPQGGAMPNVNVSISHLSMHGAVDSALLVVNGQTVQTQQVGSIPGAIQWPGSMAAGQVTLTVTPEIKGYESTLTVNGPWAFMRLLDRGSVSRAGDAIAARFVVGGRDVSYTINVGSISNPFFLRALSEFNCPSGL